MRHAKIYPFFFIVSSHYSNLIFFFYIFHFSSIWIFYRISRATDIIYKFTTQYYDDKKWLSPVFPVIILCRCLWLLYYVCVYPRYHFFRQHYSLCLITLLSNTRNPIHCCMDERTLHHFYSFSKMSTRLTVHNYRRTMNNTFNASKTQS